MHPKVVNELIQVCTILNKHRVQYLIIGGFAVGLHGYSRMSMDNYGVVLEKHDFDFWYNPSYENYFNLLNALEELGQNVQQFKDEQTPNPHKSFFRYSFPNFTLDFLPTVPGLSKFYDSFIKKEVIRINSIEIGFLSLEDLLLNKQTVGRKKDLEDIEVLKKLRGK